MDIFEAIRSRRSIRSYTEEEVTDQELNTLARAKHTAYGLCDRSNFWNKLF